MLRKLSVFIWIILFLSPLFLTNTSPANAADDPDDYCTITLKEGNNYNWPGDVSFTVTFHKGDPRGKTHRAVLRPSYRPNAWPGVGGLNGHTYPTHEMESPGVAIPDDLGASTYRIEVKENYTDYEFDSGRSCFSEYFLIWPEDRGGGHVCNSGNSVNCNTPDDDPNGVAESAPLSLPCQKNDSSYSEGEGCLKIRTSLGNVRTDAAGFTRWVLGFVLSIAGGIVIIIIIVAGYKLMTSQGDPEKVKNARDQLTAAIVGLLFIIFSLALLELITRDILGLPGFGG